MMKSYGLADEIIIPNSARGRIWRRRLKKVRKGRKLTKKSASLVERRVALKAELEEINRELTEKCTHPRALQECFEASRATVQCTDFYAGWGSEYETVRWQDWCLKCTVCGQVTHRGRE